MESHTFGKWDYIVFGVMLALSVSIGIYQAIVGRHGRLEEYLLAGRSMTFFPVALSLMATFTSSITMLGASAEAYGHGIMWSLSEIAFSVGNLLELYLLLPLLKRLNISSPFQFLEGRFKSRALRITVTVLACVENLFYLSIILFGQGIALQAVTGFSMTWSIVVTSSGAVLYTTIGGLKAVIWTDVLQYILMYIGMLAMIIKGTIDSGGIQEIWSRVMDGGRLTFIFDLDPTIRHTVWNVGVARVFCGFGWLFKPAYLQRITSTKSLTQARRAMLLGLFCSPAFGVLSVISGLLAYGYYDNKRCDPMASNQISNLDQVLPFMMLDIFRNLPGMPGLFLSALFSASLSSLSSGVSALANITWEDFIKPRAPQMSDVRQLFIAKIAVLTWGVLVCCLALLVSHLGSTSILQIYYSASSVTAGPVSSLFYLGALFPFVNTRSAILALLTGLSFLTWLVVGASVSQGVRQTPPLPPAPTDHCPSGHPSYSMTNITLMSPNSTNHNLQQFTGSGLDAFYSLSYTLYQCFGFLIVLVVGVALSLATGGNMDGVNPLYVRKYLGSREPEEEYVMTEGTQMRERDSTDRQLSEAPVKH